jgi:asparagine synthase (glutamine-hydrolysing)
MCGIIGFNFADRSLGTKMIDTIRHRGPNDGAVFVGPMATIGNRRLAVIDLSDDGRQPMLNNSNTIALVYNGEIYNYQKIRQELISKGHTFKSNTDTEVVLRGYEEFGRTIVDKLEGMWSFAVYDVIRGQIILSRDFFGIKPLYYYHQNGKMVFASEIKAIQVFLEKENIKVHLSNVGCDSYFSLGYSVSPFTIFDEIKKVAPGETLVFDLSSDNVTSYLLNWTMESPKESNPNNFENVILDSVGRHLVSDVPVGILLSGGVDSTLIALSLKKLGKRLHAYTVRIPGRHDADFARQIADFSGLDQEEIVLDEKNFEEMYVKVWGMLDEPIADPSLFPSLLVAKKVAETSTVVITGEGGDELFWGYPRHLTLGKKNKILPPPLINVSLNFLRYPESIFYLNHLKPLFRRFRYFYSKNRQDLLGSYLELASIDSDFYNRLRLVQYLAKMHGQSGFVGPAYFDEKIYLPNDLLYKTDFATMAYSVEGRVPLLDKSVYQFASNLSPMSRMFGGVGKKIVKEYLAKNLPPHLVFRQKEGFGLPLKTFLVDRYDQEIKEAISYLLEARIVNLSRGGLRKMLQEQSFFDFVKLKFPTLLFSLLSFYKVSRKYHICFP